MNWNERPKEMIYERKDLTSTVTAPFLQAAGIGAAVAIPLFVVSWGWIGVGWQAALEVSATFGLVATSLELAHKYHHSLVDDIYKREEATQTDINKDGYVGRPPIIVRGNVVEEVEEDRTRTELCTFVKMCGTGDTSVRRFEHQMPRWKYQMFRDNLIEAGLARWRSDDRRQGWELVGEPDEIMSRFN